MLNDQQSQELCKEILDNNKEVMKDILALARQGLDAERFNFFRKEVFREINGTYNISCIWIGNYNDKYSKK